jgi:hypothetical protein
MWALRFVHPREAVVAGREWAEGVAGGGWGREDAKQPNNFGLWIELVAEV